MCSCCVNILIIIIIAIITITTTTGVAFYAASNVLQESVVKSGGTNREEYLTIMPFIGE